MTKRKPTTRALRAKAPSAQNRAKGEGTSPSSRGLARHLGNVIRELRTQDHLTISELAAQAGISGGMLSKIETGQAATSLDTLARIAHSLGVCLSSLFRNYDMPDDGAQLVKNGAGMEVVRRGTRRGHTYHLLAHNRGLRRSFEPFLITIDHASEVFPSFEHSGTEFIYMLKGKLEYRHGEQTYTLEPGDALSFRGDVAHGPKRLIDLPIFFLSIIVYGPGD